VPFSVLAAEDRVFAAFFFNPNIHPQEEYQKRLETLREYANNSGVELIEGDYDPDTWQKALAGSRGVYPLIKGSADYEENLRLRSKRCRRCYEHRFEKLAEVASEKGFSSIATTLSISPYQFISEMEEALRQAAYDGGVESAFEDYRSYYQDSVVRSKELGMYRQNYCGCHYSKAEAEVERAARKNARKVK
jgi:predicted adenine nucleotide alpha hydrolase (AANH) superfamily ATPase